jgi:hypothetical protein
VWADLIDVAHHLLDDISGKPATQASIRRSISTSYYALFAATSTFVADRFVNLSTSAQNRTAWCRVYRSLEHSQLKNVAKQIDSLTYNNDVLIWAKAFLHLQENRHAADYDPEFEPTYALGVECLSLASSACNSLLTLPPAIATDLATQLAFRSRR